MSKRVEQPLENRTVTMIKPRTEYGGDTNDARDAGSRKTRTPMGGRLSPLLAAGLLLTAVGAPGGCVATSDLRREAAAPARDVAGFVRGLWPDPVPPAERTWRRIESNTAVTWIGDDTARIEARGGPFTGIETVELRLLARAAGEGAARRASRFKIVHLRDRKYAGAGRLFGFPLEAGRTTHIGAYEDLVASRYERDWAAPPRAWVHPGLTAVVIFTEDDPTRRRPLFEVEETYRNLVMDGMME